MRKRGNVTLICGPMFSQKSTEATMILEKNQILGTTMYLKVTFRAQKNKIESTEDLTTHGGKKFIGFYVQPDFDLFLVNFTNQSLVAIVVDEIHFLSLSKLKEITKEIVNRGIDLILVGIDVDYLGEVFETTAWASVYANDVIRKTAICTNCKSTEAKYNYNAVNSDDGNRFREGENLWFPLCLDCFQEKTGIII